MLDSNNLPRLPLNSFVHDAETATTKFLEHLVLSGKGFAFVVGGGHRYWLGGSVAVECHLEGSFVRAES
jgi:hypothetical protein